MHRNSLGTRLQLLLPAAVLVFLVSCAGIHVRTDYNHATNFAEYHTYSWLKVDAGNAIWAQRIRRDVDRELASKGWTEVPSGGEEAVSAFGSTREQRSLETFYSGFGPGFGGWYWGGFNNGVATTYEVYTPIGTLVVDVFDNSSKHLIWRGTAQQVLSDKPSHNQKKLANAVTDMFKKFPPRVSETEIESSGR